MKKEHLINLTFYLSIFLIIVAFYYFLQTLRAIEQELSMENQLRIQCEKDSCQYTFKEIGPNTLEMSFKKDGK